MPRPLVGLTCSTDCENGAVTATIDRLKRPYAAAIREAGGTPVLLPTGDGPQYDDLLDHLEGVLLTGGRDIAPGLYGEDVLNQTVDIDAARDVFELPLIRAAVERDVPILGICRGIQALNVALGGTLYQDIPSQLHQALRHRQTEAGAVATHPMSLVEDSPLTVAFGAGSVRVNTFHHQAVREVAPGLVVAGRSPDDVIEALYHPSKRFVVAVQYHPEEMVGVCAASRGLFTAFVRACRTGRR